MAIAIIADIKTDGLHYKKMAGLILFPPFLRECLFQDPVTFADRGQAGGPEGGKAADALAAVEAAMRDAAA